MLRECKICNTIAVGEDEFVRHLSSELHRRLSLSRLFYIAPIVPPHIQEQISIYSQDDSTSNSSTSPLSSLESSDSQGSAGAKSNSPEKKRLNTRFSEEREVAPVVPVVRNPPKQAPFASFADIAKRNLTNSFPIVIYPGEMTSMESKQERKIEGDKKSDVRKRKYEEPKEKRKNVEELEPPKLGWCEDKVVLERREKDIQKGKNSDVYKRYIAEVSKDKRMKGVHPKTPNKQINFSRRSWDSQVRLWRKMLHVWAGEGGNSLGSSPEKENCEEATVA